MLSRRVTVKSLDLIQSLVECCSRLQKLSVSDLVLLLDRTSLLAIFGRLVVGSVAESSDGQRRGVVNWWHQLDARLRRAPRDATVTATTDRPTTRY